MHFKAVIFDLDGTLLDSLDDLADTLNTVLLSHAFETHDREKIRQMVGYGMKELVRKALPPNLRNRHELLETLQKEMHDRYAANWQNKTKPYPEIPPLLDWLGKTSIKKGVLSNKPDRFTKMCVETLLFSWQFDCVMGERPGIRLKPDPEGALVMAREMQVAPHEVLYIGDGETDMQTATAAGMYPLGVLWGFRTKEALLKSGAKSLAATAREIIELLTEKKE